LIILLEDVALNSNSYYFDRSGDRSGSDNMANREDQSVSARRSHCNARSGATSARRINRVREKQAWLRSAAFTNDKGSRQIRNPDIEDEKSAWA
jgi:hypothetical protein